MTTAIHHKRLGAGNLRILFVLLVAPLTVVAQTSGELRAMGDTYLEGTGSQAIDVGCTVGPKTRIVTEIYYEAPASGSYTYYLFGVDSGRRDFTYLQNNDNGVAACRNGTWGGTGGSAYIRSGARYLHDYNNKSGKWTVTAGTAGIQLASVALTTGTATSTATLGLFTRSKGNGSYDNGLPLMRVYSCRVYEDDVLIRDLIPYGYGALTGMVDRCTGKVYTDVRKSKTPFKIGTDAAYVVSDASFGEWLDTGYRLTSNTKIEADFAISQVRANQTIFGAGGGEGAWFRLYGDADNKFSSGCQDGALDGVKLLQTDGKSDIKTDGRRYKYVLDLPNNLETLVYGEMTMHSAAPAHTITKSATVPLGIFAYPTADDTGKVTAAYGGGVRIYSFKIWENGTLVRDYVPRLVDSVAKLYDRQNQQYATQKTVAGPEWGGTIETVVEHQTTPASNGDAYLLSHASEYIDTGYRPTPTSRYVMDCAWRDVSGTWYSFGLSGYVGHYEQNGSDIAYYFDGTQGQYKGAGVTADEARFTCDMDFSKKKITWTRVGVAKSHTMSGVPTADATSTLYLFGRNNGGSINGAARLKLYSFTIYEGDELKHQYYPEMNGKVAGLRDRKTGDFLPKSGGSSDFAFFGAGSDGQGLAIADQPQSCTISVQGSHTLSAYAPGAVGYQWFKNGKLVEGAISATLDVDWHKGTPRSDVYQCVALYSVFGYAASDAVTVTNDRTGALLLVR